MPSASPSRPFSVASVRSTTSSSGGRRMSQATDALLQDMMRKSGLQPNQMRRLSKSIDERGTLPPTCPPSVHRPVLRAATATDMSTNPFGDTSSRRASSTMLISERRSSIRTRDAIPEGETERRAPRPMKDRVAEKDRLINLMASNGTSTEPMVEGHVRARRWRTAEEREQEPLDEFTMLMEEIEERQQWLEEMTALGQGDKYRRQVQAEISMRVSRMEKLERERRGE